MKNFKTHDLSKIVRNKTAFPILPFFFFEKISFLKHFFFEKIPSLIFKLIINLIITVKKELLQNYGANSILIDP